MRDNDRIKYLRMALILGASGAFGLLADGGTPCSEWGCPGWQRG
jgi:hypothetical protein